MKAIMKSLSLVLALLMVLALAACGSAGTETPAADTDAETTAADSGSDVIAADPGDDIPVLINSDLLGSWEYQGGGYIYTFNEDGTGTYDIGAESPMIFTYEATDAALSILYDGNTEAMELEYSIDGNVLNIKDSFGSDTLYNRK